jgi:hypothetical protein
MTKTINGIEIFNPIEHGIHGQPLMVPAHEYNKLLYISIAIDKCLSEMRDEHKIHGHITDSSAQYMINLKPVFEKLCLPSAKDQPAGA